jgi:hypothetical protein
MRTGIQEFRDQGLKGYLCYSLPVFMICLFAQQDYAGMRAVVDEFLQLVNPAHQILYVVFGFPALSLLQLLDGAVEKAVEYYAYASSHGYIGNSIWYRDLVGKPIEKAAERLLPDVREAAWDRGRRLDPFKEIQDFSMAFNLQLGGSTSNEG